MKQMILSTDYAIKLSRLGYWTRYGSDGKLHLIHRSEFRRGARGMCGHIASRRDYEHKYPLCEKCMAAFIKEQENV
jgi:hypothetical protein